ncbi:uncharacterized protein LOC141910535 [Tubulanus polymorphus]|uniref:uncharacterized protein LOC141910535 n=1 Tax=Tubulanus polymorphus TaxID=672921 RepID=UPI003DA4ED87
MDEEVTLQKNRRRGLRGSVTRYITECENIINSEITDRYSELELLLRKLQKKLSELQEVHENILSVVTNGTVIDSLYKEHDEFDFTAEKTMYKVERFVKSLDSGVRVVPEQTSNNSFVNLPKAVSVLKDRFGQDFKLTNAYMKALLNKAKPENKTISLRKFYDEIQNYVRSLESLGKPSEHYGDFLTPVILEKLQADFVRNMACANGSVNWSFRSLIECMYRELEILESVDIRHTIPSTGYGTGEITTFVVSSSKYERTNRNCAYCEGQHASMNCTKYKTVSDRKMIIKQKRLCLNCLRKFHMARQCASQTRCKSCKKLHHTSICERDNLTSKNLATAQGSVPDSNSSTVQQSESSDIVISASDAVVQTSVCQYLNVSVMLETAIAPVSTGHLTTDARISFDGGSQRTFMTQELADLLEIKADGSESLSIAAFNKDPEFRTFERANVKLVIDTGQNIPLTVLIVPSISAPIRNHVASLLWKLEHCSLPDNFNVVMNRTRSTVNRLRNKGLMLTYNDIIRDQKMRGFIEEVPLDEYELPSGSCHYLAHHPVYRNSATTPVRIVYDCSCRETKNSASLNDCLETGPALQNDIISILLRFRLKNVAILADIEKAFLQIRLKTPDRDFTRFLWITDINDPSKGFKLYRFKVVLFGARSTPFILNATVLKHLKSYSSDIATIISDNIYVDNVSISVETHEAGFIYSTMRSIFADGGFNIRSFVSNSTDVTAKAKSENVSSDVPIAKNLGLEWTVSVDEIGLQRVFIPDMTSLLNEMFYGTHRVCSIHLDSSLKWS